MDGILIKIAIASGERPDKPEHGQMSNLQLDEEIWQKMEVCWSLQPSDRPTATALKAFMQIRA
jgi:hypothetical protein